MSLVLGIKLTFAVKQYGKFEKASQLLRAVIVRLIQIIQRHNQFYENRYKEL